MMFFLSPSIIERSSIPRSSFPSRYHAQVQPMHYSEKREVGAETAGFVARCARFERKKEGGEDGGRKAAY